MNALDVSDLVRLPYKLGGRDPARGVDCLWTTRRVLERIYPDLDPIELPCGPEEERAMIERIAQQMHRWFWVGAGATHAAIVGDVIHGTIYRHPYVAVLVDSTKKVVLTASPERGIHVLDRSKLAGVQSVYRRRPQ